MKKLLHFRNEIMDIGIKYVGLGISRLILLIDLKFILKKIINTY